MLQQRDLFVCSQPCILQMGTVADALATCMWTLYWCNYVRCSRLLDGVTRHHLYCSIGCCNRWPFYLHVDIAFKCNCEKLGENMNSGVRWTIPHVTTVMPKYKFLVWLQILVMHNRLSVIWDEQFLMWLQWSQKINSWCDYYFEVKLK